MNADALFQLLAQARKLCGHSEYVVIGSLSILGVSGMTEIPTDMTMSIDADCYTLHDPPRALDLQQALGEGSAFHRRHGIYLDPVTPQLASLPEGWEARRIRMDRGGVTAWFIEPHDAAVSKLARGEPRDVRWVAAGLKAHILAWPTIKLRMKATTFLDEAEEKVALGLLEKLKPSR